MCPNWRQCCRIGNSSSPSGKTYSILKVDVKGKHESIIVRSHQTKRPLFHIPATQAQAYTKGRKQQTEAYVGERDPQAATITTKFRRAHLCSVNCAIHLQSGPLWHPPTSQCILLLKLKVVPFGSLGGKIPYPKITINSFCVRYLIRGKVSVFIVIKMIQ